ncbi:methyltransferase domain-containing protein, partial [Thiomonas arsenitoxydans]|uniref:methyltransferase domain-containing protein n=1 Tax=Thiomonas arsenitoxydans (strain DSM 22701 / CIP 110005 / 3As) TaxID=426114 RepID=UPI001ACED3BC
MLLDKSNKKNFYLAFEDQYRGSRALIKERLRVYLPFVEPLLTVYSSCEALDIGCGRGEWIELLTDTGFSVSGVDLDKGMLEAC